MRPAIRFDGMARRSIQVRQLFVCSGGMLPQYLVVCHSLIAARVVFLGETLRYQFFPGAFETEFARGRRRIRTVLNLSLAATAVSEDVVGKSNRRRTGADQGVVTVEFLCGHNFTPYVRC